MCERERKIGDDFGHINTPREYVDNMLFSLFPYYFLKWWSIVYHYSRLLSPDTVDYDFHRQRSTDYDYSGLLTTAVAVYYPRRWRSIVHRYRKSQSTVCGSSSPLLRENQSTHCPNHDFYRIIGIANHTKMLLSAKNNPVHLENLNKIMVEDNYQVNKEINN
jgi:hypothetical protein